jgi:prevent-host-death family protein
MLVVQVIVIQKAHPMPRIPKIIPISDLRQNAGGIIRNISSSREPVFITQRGRAAVVMVSMKSHGHAMHENETLRSSARGEKETAAGAGYGLDEVMREADKILNGERS